MVKTSAAWLIEHAGFHRGYGNDRVRLSTKHTLALTNRGPRRPPTCSLLPPRCNASVAAVFGVELGLEPVVVGVD